MSQGDHVKISHASEVEKKAPHLIKRLQDWDYSIPLSIKLEPWVDTRTLALPRAQARTHSSEVK